MKTIGLLADMVHNLAEFSAKDFAEFKEEWFWDDFELLRTKYPDFIPPIRPSFDKFIADTNGLSE